MKLPSARSMSLLLGLALAALATGCSPERYRESADREVYGVLQQKTPAVPGMVEEFTIEQAEKDPLEGCPTGQEVAADRVEDEVFEVPEGRKNAAVLSLAKALEIAAVNSREYQDRKESLYLSALGLTLQRHAFAPQLFGRVGGDYDNTGLGDEEQVSGDTDFGFDWLLATGTRLGVSLGTTVSQYLTGDPRKSASSLLQVTVNQPLLQGAGLAVTEPLTQAERNVIYQMRSFVRFRRRFFVDILSEYYEVLRQEQVLENERRNYENLDRTEERFEWRARAGRIAGFEVDRISQDVLRAADRLEVAQQRYQAAVDAFKVTLGLPTEADVVLDPRELTRLTAREPAEIEFTAEDLVETALVNRLDLITACGEVVDAERQLKVAANDLLPGLDLSASLSAGTDGENSPLDFDAHQTDTSVGFELDLPLDRKAERNAYRSQLISLRRARRNREELRDRIVQEVRDSWRQYRRAARSYRIQERSVELAQERVKSARMRLEAGRAETQDLLDARDDLIGAQNSVARTLVDYRVARLDLARAMDILSVGPRGTLEESFDEYK